MNALQINDNFIYQGRPRYSYDNGQKEMTRRLARLDRFYTPTQNKLNNHQSAYFIIRHVVG